MAEQDGKVYVDWDDGIKRVMNNAKLYTRLLDKFKSSTYLNDLSTALGSGDMPGAQTAAHTIKGTAANLSLLELQKQALDVETQIKAGAVKPDAVEGLNACFAETLTAIDKAIAAHG